jgi:hypothetical protein
VKRLGEAAELLDGPLDARALRGNLRDLARINRLLGGSVLSWRALDAIGWPAHLAPITLLDVGTGVADIPRDLLRRAARRGLALEVTATDVRPEMVVEAEAAGAGTPGLTVRQIGEDLSDIADDAFDVVHASLVAHHLEPGQLIDLLAAMRRVARRAVIINDLDRARRWWIGAWLLTRVATGNRYTRHDAPLSVRRAYRPDELSALAARADLVELRRLRDRLGHRYALVLVPR